MDPVRNPYAPGAGAPPPELAGRDSLRERVSIALRRIGSGKHAKSVLLVGLRGVGKTVLLDKIRVEADAAGFETIRIEAPEDRSLPAMLAPALRVSLLKLSRVEKAREMGERALKALAGFARSLKVKYGDIEVGLDFEPEPGLADNGDLATDLTALFEEAGKAAAAADTAVVIFIDELQYLKQHEFAAVITALHKCAQLQLPITVVGAGLPQLRALAGKAKSYAERLFDYPEVGALNDEDSAQALRKPALDEGADFTDEAILLIVEKTKGYPYFLQEWGKHSWDIAEQSPVSAKDVIAASKIATAALDESFFRVRFDRLTPAEKNYLSAMALLGAGPHRSGDIAQQLGKDSTALSPVRNNLISKGMIWSPSFGDTAFTVPLFDEYMRRIMPLEKGT